MDRVIRKRSCLSNNLPQLQNLIKRDCSAYKDEFLQQFHHYQALMRLFLVNPAQESPKLQELVIFVSQVCQCYPEETANFPEHIQTLLQQHGAVLHPEVRMSLCRSLILMRNKDFLQPQSVLELFFELFRCQDKALRSVVYTHIVSDIKRINSKHKNNRVNKGLQSFMYTMLSDTNPVATKMSLDVMIELYRKNIWNDANTVNVITTACFSPFTKVVVAALHFFLTGDGSSESTESDSSGDESDGETKKALRTVIISKQMTKKGKKRERKVSKAQAKIKRKKKPKLVHQPAFSALHLINDPQSFAEKLFKKLEFSKDRFEVKLMLMSLISRLIGFHQLFLFNYYPFLQRYLQPHQYEVTKILTYLAQASHELVPAEVLEPSIRAIVNNFISERNSNEVMAVGLNAVREMCVRCPLCMTPELLQDLTSYKSYHDKGVMMAARSLIQLFRDLNPLMLNRKDRGKPVEYVEHCKVKDYGELMASEFVPGSELVDLPSDDPTEMESSCEIGQLPEMCINKRHISKEDSQCLKKQLKDKAVHISQSRLLTQEEFEEIQIKKHASLATPRKGKKQQILDLLCSQEERRQACGEILSESVIETVDHKKLALDKEARLAMVQAGREGRKQYSYSKKRLHVYSSTTNKEKVKNKAFMMIRHKRNVRGKNKKSFREKQMALRNSLLKQKRAK